MGTQPVPARTSQVVTAAPESYLDQLESQRVGAVAAFADAKARLESINTAIKAEAARLAAELNGGRVPETIRLPGTAHRPPLRMTWTRPWRFDMKRFKREQPHTYVAYANRSPGQWDLREDKGGTQ